MVLQRAPKRAIVWGFSDTNRHVTLEIGSQLYQTKSGLHPVNEFGESIWSVTLDPQPDGGPNQIHVHQTLPNGTLVTLTLNDVYFGDVWICSGQSNMQMTVRDIFNGSIEIANADKYPKIRLFTAALKPSAAPIEELLGIEQNWSIPSADSVGGPSWTYISAVCWLYGRMIHEALGGIPIGLIVTSWGGTAIELWMPPEPLHECGISSDERVPLQPYNEPLGIRDTLNNSNLYNAMIYPFTRMVIYGSIWYQGESNADYNRDKYTCTFSKMIQTWRQIWFTRTNNNTDIQFPFGFVQLSTFRTDGRMVGGFPWIRWHQTFDVGYVPNHVVPNVFMAVALDLRDDPNLIHPRTKHDVAYRLSRAGLAVAYGQSVEYLGPIVSNVTLSNDRERIYVTYTAVSEISLRSTDGFEVCCRGERCATKDNDWEPLTISGKTGLTITLTIRNICARRSIYGFRYLWRETPCPFKQAPIYSFTDANLPSPPYLKVF
ncbi:unnamed protein product [Adineta ricciae]|uniref:Sialate O-acetylesterase domain-containing protein n=2 Tax=Adineta ricciae TaxID=249248 RepID=A0A815SBN2_ADIRI|nr:unnamed protein product [Adineta ricciae]